MRFHKKYERFIPKAPCTLILATLAATPTYGDEISLINGFYQNEEYDNTGAKGGKKTVISLGGRYSKPLFTRLHWYGEGQIALKNYDDNAGGVSPADSTGIVLGGGVRYYFGKVGDHFATYASTGGRYRAEKDGRFNGNTASTTEVNGLYYGAGFGLRLYLGSQFFCDFEAPLFESALFGTETETTEIPAGTNVTKTDVEKKRTELFATTSTPLTKTLISLGMKF